MELMNSTIRSLWKQSNYHRLTKIKLKYEEHDCEGLHED